MASGNLEGKSEKKIQSLNIMEEDESLCALQDVKTIKKRDMAF